MFRPAVLGGMWGWRDGSLKNKVNTRGYRNPRIPPHPPLIFYKPLMHMAPV